MIFQSSRLSNMTNAFRFSKNLTDRQPSSRTISIESELMAWFGVIGVHLNCPLRLSAKIVFDSLSNATTSICNPGDHKIWKLMRTGEDLNIMLKRPTFVTTHISVLEIQQTLSMTPLNPCSSLMAYCVTWMVSLIKEYLFIEKYGID